VVLPDGRVLVGARELAEDEDDDYPDPVPPTPLRVARRALAMCAVTCRASLERGAGNPTAEGIYAQLGPWLRGLDLESELEPHEAQLIAAPLGTLSPQQAINGTWLAEGLAVLAWALGRHELSAYDEGEDPPPLTDSLGFLNEDDAPALLASPRLRPAAEIEAYAASVLTLHWRLRDFGLRPQPMDFAKFVREAKWGPLTLEGLRLADGDLAIGANPIAKAPADHVRYCQSIAQERHRAANWLLGYESVYSEVDTST
jgi:hypothetical protein